MFIKIESKDAADRLEEKGFYYMIEHVNGKTFYCFESSEKLAALILSEFADERLVVDDHLHF